MAIRTIKLPYHVSSASASDIQRYIVNYNNVLRYTYNRLKDADFKISTAELTRLQKQMNNVFIDSHFLNSAQFDARQLKNAGTVIFGGRNNFLDRARGKLSKEEFQLRRLRPLMSVGMANEYGNRKFRILPDMTIQFQPDRHNHY